MKVIWAVDEAGTIQRALNIPEKDFRECATDEERQAVVEQALQHEFEQSVGWVIISQEVI